MRKAALLMAVLSSLTVAGQDEAGGEVFQLAAFEVVTDGDRGYLSTNAISGTSLNMAIRDLPMPLEVLNQEFIEDLQATNLKESLAYSSGVFTQTFSNGTGANTASSQERSPSTAADVNNPFTNAISIRGYAVPNQQRYGFRVGSIAVGEGFSTVLGGITDTSNVERMEVVRGPASLLYGVNVLSGVVNILPKEPLLKQRTQVQLTVGSDDFRRGTLDVTGPLVKDKLAYRLMANFQNNGDWTLFRENEQEYYVGQLKWYPTPKSNLLLEVQYSDQTQSGIGAKYFRDSFIGQAFQIDQNPANSLDFRNPYNEFIQYGYDLPDNFLTREVDDAEDIWLLPKTTPIVPQENAHLGEQYRISGPDTFFNREELNALALYRAELFKNFNMELGGYFTRVKQVERNVAMGVYGNSEGPLSTKLETTSPAQFGPRASFINEFVRNPEISRHFGGGLPPVKPGVTAFSTGQYLFDEVVGFVVREGDVPNYIGQTDSITSGLIGEVFVVPDLQQRGIAGGNVEAYTWNPKVARYMWYERPTESESAQFRARFAYSLESEMPGWLGGKARHTITAGGQFIRDQLDIVTGGVDVRNTITYGYMQNSKEPGVGFGQLGNDPYVLRDSVFDYTPIRYNGERMAIPGGLNFSSDLLGTPLRNYISQGPLPNDDLEFKIAGSGWKELTAWYRGAYAIYQGEFWKDRITFIGGMRHDSYQIKESELLRVLDGTAIAGTLLTEDAFGTGAPLGEVTRGFTVTPHLIGDGSKPYTQDRWIAGLPDELNLEVQRQVDLLREGIGPNGTTETLFPDSQTFNTATAGLSIRVADPLSIYVLYSEGVFPNQGQRDANDNPIEAEQTSSHEIGIKFDLFDRKISGTISVYRIERENATWNFAEAPAPRRWIGGRLGPDETSFQPWTNGVPFAFDPKSYLNADGVKADRYQQNSNADPERYQRASYGVVEDFVQEVWAEQIGTPFPSSINQNVVLKAMGLDWLYSQPYQINGAQFENRNRQNVDFFWVDVNRDLVAGKHIAGPEATLGKEGVDMGLLMKEALDRAMATRNYDGDPLAWRHNEAIYASGAGNNPSNVTGDLVTFEEEAYGVDGQIFFTPSDNFQAIFTFSHQQREVVGNGFNLAPLIDPVTGEKVPGTIYDKWVYVLGIDAFDDPTDPTTTNGNGVKGLDLSFAPEWNFSLWNKYTLTEGRLEGLELMAGVRWFGEAPTSVAVGSGGASNNRFPTPPTEARWQLDAGVNYSFDLWDIRWRLGLKINNVLDDTLGTSTVTYLDPDDPELSHVRRSRVVYAPRSWRLSLTATF